MPYVHETDRVLADTELKSKGGAARMPSAGCLNFVISKLCDNFIGPIRSYDKINAVIGVLECAKQELYRRLAEDYEDHKREQNGDVFMDRTRTVKRVKK